MARGWESKSVEDQMQAAEESARQKEQRLDLSPEARVRRERLEQLRLSRARTLEQLERATHPARRDMLKRTLAALEVEADALQSQVE